PRTYSSPRLLTVQHFISLLARKRPPSRTLGSWRQRPRIQSRKLFRKSITAGQSFDRALEGARSIGACASERRFENRPALQRRHPRVRKDPRPGGPGGDGVLNWLASPRTSPHHEEYQPTK